MKKKHLLLLLMFCLFLFITNDLASSSRKDVVQNTYRYITVDSFNNPGTWVVEFTKYRSENWDRLKDKYQEPEEWAIWLSSNENKSVENDETGIRVSNTKTIADKTESKHKEKISKEDIIPYYVSKSKRTDYIDTVFGVKAKWDLKGANTIYIKPYNNYQNRTVKHARIAKDNITALRLEDEEYIRYERKYPDQHYILLPALVKELYVYVWGSLFNYKMDAIIEDFTGQTYIIPAGRINHSGWKLIKIKIPDFVKQKTLYFPRPKPVKFKGFKLTTLSREGVKKGAYFYFSYFHALCDIYFESFFGEALENSQRFWSIE